jgi:hypothetical protein
LEFYERVPGASVLNKKQGWSQELDFKEAEPSLIKEIENRFVL